MGALLTISRKQLNDVSFVKRGVVRFVLIWVLIAPLNTFSYGQTRWHIENRLNRKSHYIVMENQRSREKYKVSTKNLRIDFHLLRVARFNAPVSKRFAPVIIRHQILRRGAGWLITIGNAPNKERTSEVTACRLRRGVWQTRYFEKYGSKRTLYSVEGFRNRILTQQNYTPNPRPHVQQSLIASNESSVNKHPLTNDGHYRPTKIGYGRIANYHHSYSASLQAIADLKSEQIIDSIKQENAVLKSKIIEDSLKQENAVLKAKIIADSIKQENAVLKGKIATDSVRKSYATVLPANNTKSASKSGFWTGFHQLLDEIGPQGFAFFGVVIGLIGLLYTSYDRIRKLVTSF